MDLAKIDLANVESTFQINVVAMFGIVKHALPYMKRGASIINTTSVTAYKGSGGFMDYGSSKGAIVSFTRSLSVQLSPKGIRANAVAPGPIYTPLQPAARPADQLDGFGAGAVPLHGRAGQPAEVGPVYCWLASAEANCEFVQRRGISRGTDSLTRLSVRSSSLQTSRVRSSTSTLPCSAPARQLAFSALFLLSHLLYQSDLNIMRISSPHLSDN